MGGFVLFLTLYATQYSGNTLVGFAGRAYRDGYDALVLITFLSAAVGAWLFYAPKLFRLSREHHFITPIDFIEYRFNYKWISGNVEYKRYDSKFLFLEEVFKYSISFMPEFEKKRFDPYINISSSYLYLNKNYDLKLQSIYLFEDKNIFNDITENNIMLFDFEFGFIFDDFKISFIRKNSLGFKTENVDGGIYSFVAISDEIKYIKYDYIELIWIFKD